MIRTGGVESIEDGPIHCCSQNVQKLICRFRTCHFCRQPFGFHVFAWSSSYSPRNSGGAWPAPSGTLHIVDITSSKGGNCQNQPPNHLDLWPTPGPPAIHFGWRGVLKNVFPRGGISNPFRTVNFILQFHVWICLKGLKISSSKIGMLGERDNQRCKGSVSNHHQFFPWFEMWLFAWPGTKNYAKKKERQELHVRKKQICQYDERKIPLTGSKMCSVIHLAKSEHMFNILSSVVAQRRSGSFTEAPHQCSSFSSKLCPKASRAMIAGRQRQWLFKSLGELVLKTCNQELDAIKNLNTFLPDSYNRKGRPTISSICAATVK